MELRATAVVNDSIEYGYNHGDLGGPVHVRSISQCEDKTDAELCYRRQRSYGFPNGNLDGRVHVSDLRHR